MKFTIEVDDFWLDQENELEPALTKFIINEVTHKINKSIEAKVNDQINRQLHKEFEIGYAKVVKSFITEAWESGELMINDSGNKKTAKQYFLDKFGANDYYGQRDALEKLAKKHADTIKGRYDLQYAAHVVSKLSENGLSKDDEIKKLISS